MDRTIVVIYDPETGNVRGMSPDGSMPREDARALRRQADVIDGWADRDGVDR